MDALESRLRRRAVRSLVIQIAGAAMFVVCAVVLGNHGEWAGAVVFALLALVPLGLAVFWGRIIHRGSAAVLRAYNGRG